MSTDHISPRVNSARLPNFIGRPVRLACKVLTFSGDTALVQASDDGQVKILLLPDAHLSDTYAEIIGSVVDATTIRMMACINLGSELDMKLVNDTIELIHDPRYYGRIFS